MSVDYRGDYEIHLSMESASAGWLHHQARRAGGFGEVYFALSDGGKEVALKLIRGHTDVELRGIANCINLKHPYLVHLYDLRTDAQNDRWLVMEYVHGEPLNVILQRHPRRFAGGPGSGVVSANRTGGSVSARSCCDSSRHQARESVCRERRCQAGRLRVEQIGLDQSTPAIGLRGNDFLHGPRKSRGQYSKRTDIYACGVMLYEMLTGEVPFHGENAAEVGLKHQIDTPDLGKVPFAYVPILEKALHKNPEKRYANMNEMIEAVDRLMPRICNPGQCCHPVDRDFFTCKTSRDSFGNPSRPADAAERRAARIAASGTI